MQPLFHPSPLGHHIAYQHQSGDGVGVMFCCGYRSDMASTKATALAEFCAAHHIPFTRFDYFSHGATGGDFEQFTIGTAIRDTTEILDNIATQDTILVGSSMGAWIALSIALERKHKVRGLVTIAAAPDFTENLMFARFTPEQRRTLEEEGKIWAHSEYFNNDYPITKHFIEEARQHLMLDDVIGLDIPIHLIHGQDDVDVPWETSLRLASKIMGDEVLTTFIKDGDHRLNRPQDLEIMLSAIARILSKL